VKLKERRKSLECERGNAHIYEKEVKLDFRKAELRAA
jgi:hypothetical protein